MAEEAGELALSKTLQLQISRSGTHKEDDETPKIVGDVLRQY